MSKSASLIPVKFCRVCNDFATGFNYNALVCEPCKSFFRRRYGDKNLVCFRGTNNCTINVKTRILCKRCRLVKCFKVGMQVNKLQTKRGRAANDDATADKTMTTLDKKITTYQMVDLDGVFFVSNRQMFSKDITLSFIERSLIEKINQASTVFGEESTLPVTGHVNNIIDAVNLPGSYINKVVKFCKRSVQFKSLNEADQLAIIKPYFCEVLSMRFAFVFSSAEDGFPIIKDETAQTTLLLKMDVLRVGSFALCIEVYRSVMNKLKLQMNNDVTIRNLLAMLIMFRPRSELNVSCPELMRYYYCIYKRLLARYLEFKHGNLDIAEDRLNKLMQVVEEVCQMRKPIKQLYCQLNVKQINEVLTEIYELK